LLQIPTNQNMSNSQQSAIQAKAESVVAMGEELGELYSALWQQLTWLHHKWGDFIALYGKNQERIDILNSTAPSFFRTIQDCLWENILLHLARVTDSSQSSRKDNLSFRRLPLLINHQDTRAKVQASVDTAIELTKFCRDWRNRRIAHGDLQLALGRPTQPLAAASRDHVRDALSELDSILNLVSTHYLASTTMFSHAAEPNAGGGTSALYYLRAGFQAEKARSVRLRNGTHSKEDITRPSI
jgi:AbiU2